ncbi:MAG: copper ABC transporter ATP-binding protein [Bacteroidetes bacterium]|nr:MAG: copper ABC transporter ATP-binding protein [Bacteroidota bacterium]PTM10060.1 MAG: copper ABC transporter ATP-binding protein [Bacteroidota bacterium]
MIDIQNLHKSYGKLAVLRGIDLNLSQTGQISAILGPNGSGKTTLIKSILGLVIPDQGDIRMDGQTIKGQWAYRHHISYLPQIARFPENLTVTELLAMIKDLRSGPTDDDALIQLFGLGPHLQKRLGDLSGGTKQKVNLVIAFMYDSPVIILDEPTSGLDPVAMIHLRELLQRARQQGKIILLSTHIMSFVDEMADEVVFLLEGAIRFRGTLVQLKTQYQEDNVERAIANILQGESPILA